jgi:hypothetical protein
MSSESVRPSSRDSNEVLGTEEQQVSILNDLCYLELILWI